MPCPATLSREILAGKPRAIAKGITLAESSLESDHRDSATLQNLLQKHTGKALRIGLSGIPGVGKSSLLEAWGSELLKKNPALRLGILAVDPSSPVRGGSLLGDKTRMETLASHPRAFIRPSPGGDHGGGINKSCRESINILDAAGYDLIVVETIGTGQSEYEVASVTDLFMMIQMPSTGDELQSMKKGALELADLIVIHKADGHLLEPARQLAHWFNHTIRERSHDISSDVQVILVSSQERTGLSELNDSIHEITARRKKSGEFAQRRRRQLLHWLHQEIDSQLKAWIKKFPDYHSIATKTEASVMRGELTPPAAASLFLRQLAEKIRISTSE